MDDVTLRKVQLELLAMLKDIDQVCSKYQIAYFLDSGTLLGAIRHQGFIPWDDDLDIGMLRSDYDRFSAIAQKELGDSYFWQTWKTESGYAYPFGKVRKRHTVYLEEKSSVLKENGFFIDVLPYDFAPDNPKEQKRLKQKQLFLFRCILMKDRYKPWIEQNRINLKKRLGYLIYQFISLFFRKDILIDSYEQLSKTVKDRKLVYQQNGKKYYPVEWLNQTTPVLFEGSEFPAGVGYEEWLVRAYGDYRQLPPEEERKNRHQVYQINFSQ